MWTTRDGYAPCARAGCNHTSDMHLPVTLCHECNLAWVGAIAYCPGCGSRDVEVDPVYECTERGCRCEEYVNGEAVREGAWLG